MTQRRRHKLLFIHYNPNSAGSFVGKTLAQVDALTPEFDIRFMIAGNGPFTQTLHDKGLIVDRRQLHDKTWNLLGYGFHTVSFTRYLRRYKIDLVFVMDYLSWKPAELFAASALGIPIVAFCDFYKSPEWANSFLSKCARIVVNSDCTADRICGGELRAITQVIYNCIDVEKFQIVAGTSPNRPTLGFVGNLHEIKGVDYLIKAVPLIRQVVPKIELLIAGREREQGYEAYLKNIARESGVLDAVRFVGEINDVSAFLKKIHLLVVPSLDEPFGYVNIEAGAAGLPVVASRVGGIPEVIEDHKSGILVQPGDENAIADACLQILNNRELATAMGIRGRAIVEEKFSTSVCMPHWVRLFHEVLSVKKSRKPKKK